MDFVEKTQVCSSLAAAQHIAADKALLRTVQPHDSLLHAVGVGSDFDKQLLWVLLDCRSADEIKNFREQFPSAAQTSPVPKVPAPPSPEGEGLGVRSQKKNDKKKTNTQILNGIVSKMNQYKKQLSSIMTG
jgi:hypothetical protein